jgi:hypothetical protein
MNGSPEYIIAVVAAVLGGGAFIAAFLQALLEYLSSSSGKWKCNKAAIGSAKKHTHTSWDVRSWKLRVYYPLLQFDTAMILHQILIQSMGRIDQNSAVNKICRGEPNWFWTYITANQTLSNLNVA